MDEIWRPVVGFEGVYEVSDHGRIKRVMGGRGAVAGKILSLNRLNKKGYPTVWLHKFIDGVQVKKFMATHHVVAAAFLSPRPTPQHQINHKDGVKANNHVDNLEWVTNQENMDHSWRMGLRSYAGENNHTAKLTEREVYEIISLKGVITQRGIARRYSIGLNMIKAIHAGRSWKHITAQPTIAEHLLTVALNTMNPSKGESIGTSKLTESEVREIKLAPVSCTNPQLAKKYNVSVDTIFKIRSGRAWKHVTV